jgi:hypothetical protein
MSRQVALPQFNMDSVSDGVVLRLALPGVVVTWFVTGPRTQSALAALSVVNFVHFWARSNPLVARMNAGYQPVTGQAP